MKFTKIMALVLALMMLVCAFAACGGPGEDTSLDETDPVTDAPETNAPETDAPVEECKHTRTREIPGTRVEPTCTVDGKYTVVCRSCDLEWDEPIPSGHAYSPLKSLDGAYTKQYCTVCADVYVEDANGAKVEDYSAIEFPFFYASFDDIANIENVADKFEGVSYKDAFATQVVTFTDGEETNSYANVPTGSSAQNSNGYFEVKDDENAMAAKTFTVSFAAKFDEYPLTGKLNLLTWGIGGTEYVLLAVDGIGDIYVIGNDKAVATYSDKGWDTVSVEVDPATGAVKVTFEGADDKTATGTGKLGASATGKTDSYLRFFDDAGQFEAYIDEILVAVAK